MDFIKEQKFDLRQTQVFAENLAKKAGKLLLSYFGKTKIVVNKGKSDFATEADLASEKLILKEIKKHFPKDKIIAEESSHQKPITYNLPPKADPPLAETPRTWIVDPLDGTKNFHYGFPFWCVSIALQKDGESVVGVVYSPIAKQLFSARKGGGSFLNGKRIKVSKVAKLSEALIVAEIPRKHTSGKNFKQHLKAFSDSLPKVKRVRAFAAAAYDLALVAGGKADAYLDFSRNTKIWDISAGSLLVEEAGGKVSDKTLKNSPLHNVSILASNAKLHEKFKKLIR